MKFKHGTRRRASEYEPDLAQWWKDDQTFEKSVEVIFLKGNNTSAS